MDSVKPPDAVNWNGNVDCEWRTFKQRFMLYLQAVGLDSKPDTRKIALLLTVAGPQAVEVYNTFVFATAEDKEKFDEVVRKFDEHCSPKKNETFERYVFRSRIQQPSESFDTFLTDLKLKARTCNFGQLQESMIRDQIVFGIKDIKIRERLLREADLTLASAVKVCHASELAIQHAKTFSGSPRETDTESTAVAAVNTRQANLVNELDVKAMKTKPHIFQNNSLLQAYNGEPIKTKGKCRLRVQVKGKYHSLMFIIVPEGHESLLGDKACERLGLVRRVYSINSSEPKSVKEIVDLYPDIFKGFGVLPFTYKIKLKEGAQPVVQCTSTCSSCS
ncbi:uncharacterized protein LOC121814780 [Haplochromis burtoni]|uniref:uncharacterized protein LOC121814780 n=1 Tax=Haplochromis burtoni TaxID=8153 RepID=UPI001C2D20CC|nr:uncharacterized protein LOC121814780 [Haplochromis burtoni]